MNAVQAKFFWFTVPLTVGGIVISGLMAAGGIGLLKLKESARVLLRRVLLVAIVFEFCRAIVYALTQLEMLPIMENYMGKISEAGGGPGGEAMGQMMSLMMWIGMAMWGVWLLFKVAMMFFGSHYLNRETTKAFL